MKIMSAVMSALLSGAVVSAQAPATDGAACQRLATSLALPNTTITSAQEVAAGQFVPPAVPGGRGGGAGVAQAFADLPAFCRVAATLEPSSDSDIKAEIWLPLSGWNGKFQQVGNGGWAGSIQYGPLAAAVRRGYAAASTDTGHVGGNAQFAATRRGSRTTTAARTAADKDFKRRSAIRRISTASSREPRRTTGRI